MTKRFNNILLKSAQDTDLKETYLSIQIYLDGFSFCIYNPNTKNHIAFQRFGFDENINTPENLLKEFQTAFEENELLNQSYKKVTVIHQNELATIVPLKYFDEGNLKEYLKHTVKVLPIDYISYDTIQNIGANSVYIPFVNINNFLFQKFGEFDFYHSSTLLIDLLYKKQESSKTKNVFINVHNNSFELIFFNEQKLELFNVFSFDTAEDFIYYILFAMEQLDIDTNSIDIELLGDIEKESELFDILYKYVRNVKFSHENELPKDFDVLAKHSNYVLLNYPLLEI